MSALKDQKKGDENQPQVHSIRATLISRDVKALNKVTKDFLENARRLKVPTVGPIPMPTRRLRITTRKTPCGEGSKTWDRFQMRLHKRVLDLICTSEVLKNITSGGISANVNVEFSINDAEA